MQSKNLVDENIEFIAKRFPNCVTEALDEEGKLTKLVDFDMLKQELSHVVIDGDKERYTFVWPDKKQAILTANAPIAKTLRPCREESVDFDHTQNLYIEGDNLDVLKLLRETYLGKIKMIYIDPPYNTGNDFVYNDDFAVDTDEYLERSNQVDEQGNRMVANNDSNGRFHTDWLNMIYPRLKLAKDLLADDGAIFISIDDNEQANLKKICDEIMGESNFICTFIRQTRKGGGSMSRFVSSDHDYVIMYAKYINSLHKLFLPYDIDYLKRYKEEDDIGRYFWDTFARNRQGSSNFYTITAPDGTRLENAWIYKEEKFKELFNKGDVRFKQTINGWSVQCKQRISEDGQVMRTLLTDFTNENGTKLISEILGKNIFSYCKPIELIQHLMTSMLKEDEIILDFFSGSATTAHAVMQLNAEDGGNRKFIMVQLPEKCDEKSGAYKAGFKTICEIGKERIRRAGKKIKEELVLRNLDNDLKLPFSKIANDDKEFRSNVLNVNQDKINNVSKNLDIGFRDLKLDSSCMKDIYYSPNKTTQDLLTQFEDNIKEDRTPEDLLFQVMLDMGVMLSSEIKTLEINGKKVFNVNDGDLVCCFDKDLNDDVVTAIAKLQPLYTVFRDASMSTDSVAVNFDQIFETYSPTTTRKVI